MVLHKLTKSIIKGKYVDKYKRHFLSLLISAKVILLLKVKIIMHCGVYGTHQTKMSENSSKDRREGLGEFCCTFFIPFVKWKSSP